MKKLYKIELDIVYGEGASEDLSFAEVLVDIQTNYGLACRVVDGKGPGGGWPVVELTGTKEALDKYLDVYTDGNRGDFGTDAIKEVINEHSKLIDLGCLENIRDEDYDITDFLAAVGVKHPTVYIKIVGFKSTPGGVSVTVEAISQVVDDLIAFEKEFSVSPGSEDTFNYTFNKEILKLTESLHK